MNRKAVSQIIAALLLIAISVAAAILVYSFSMGLLGQYQSQGGTQMKQELEMEAYSWNDATQPTRLVITMRNVGSIPVQVADILLNGTPMTFTTSGMIIEPETSITISIVTTGTFTSGQAYPLKIVTADGAIFEYSVVCGQVG